MINQCILQSIECKGVFKGVSLSNIRELKSYRLEIRVRVTNIFWVIFHFLKPKSAIFTYLFPKIIVSNPIFRNFTCFPVRIAGIITIFEREEQK